MSKQEKVRVEFLTNCSPYNAGEVAGFLTKDAVKLRQRGIVRFLDDDTEDKIKREAARLSTLALGSEPGELGGLPVNNTAVVNATVDNGGRNNGEGDATDESSSEDGDDGAGEGKDSAGATGTKKGSGKKSGKKKSGKKKRVHADS